MNAAEAFRVLEKCWHAKHLEVETVMRSRVCGTCMKLQVDALEVEMSALAYALDTLRNKSGGAR